MTVQLPRQEYAVRSQICAPKGKVLIQCDLSGAEAWVVAYLADDANMKFELANGDLHSFTACALYNIPFDSNIPMLDENGKKLRYKAVTFEQRYSGKRTNHSSNYMQGPYGLMEAINTERIITISFSESKRYQTVWQSIFSSIPMWWQKTRETMFGDRTIETVYGFKRTFYGPPGDETLRTMIAFEPQSTVGDHCLGAVQKGVNEAGGLLYLDEKYKDSNEILIVNTSHDSGLIEVPLSIADEFAHEFASVMRRPLMINGEVFTIPVDVEMGERYGELEKYKL